MAPKSRYSQRAISKSAKQKEHDDNRRIALFHIMEAKKERKAMMVDCCRSKLVPAMVVLSLKL